VAIPPRTAPWPSSGAAPSYVALALLAGAMAGEAWVAAIGYLAFGVADASELGADLSKTMLLDEPGDRWSDAIAILADAVHVTLLHLPTGSEASSYTD
jgi:hypothetical protein